LKRLSGFGHVEPPRVTATGYPCSVNSFTGPCLSKGHYPCSMRDRCAGLKFHYDVFQKYWRRCREVRFCSREPWVPAFIKEAVLIAFIRVTLFSLILTVPAVAEKLVDPTTVAPEYREAAEKRRAEQIRQHDCAKKADVVKVLPRDRTAFLLQCLEGAEAANK